MDMRKKIFNWTGNMGINESIWKWISELSSLFSDFAFSESPNTDIYEIIDKVELIEN